MMKQLQKEMGIKGIWMSPYHYQANGLVDRFNQMLKQMLRKLFFDNDHEWDK